jgi:KAP family P-loop domain
MWPDTETADDLLGFQVHVDLIRTVVTNPKMLPTTIGVFGDWGGGKTSIMKMLQRDLEAEEWPEGSLESDALKKVAVIYINTWLFEGYDDAKSALLSSILVVVSEHKRLDTKVKATAKALLKSVDWMRFGKLALKHVAVPTALALLTGGLGLIPAAIGASIGLEAVEDKPVGEQAAAVAKNLEVENLYKAHQEPTLEVRAFREKFAALLKGSGVTSLVVLIDDLDRCTPERIVETLEALKLFLNVEHTAYVIGADPRIVRHAIRSRYAERSLDNPSDRDESDALVKDYLEKLIQVPYYLPRLSAAEIETYMGLLFCQTELSDVNAALCLKACEQERQRNRYGTFGYAGIKQVLNGASVGVPPGLGQALAFCSSAAPLIADGLKGNPRQVKRFLNALLLRKNLAKVARLEGIRDDVLVKLMILEYTQDKLFAELYELQAQHEGKPGQLDALESWVQKAGGDEEAAKTFDAKWTTPRTKRWLAMEPKLNGVDLRDYFWVARDKLASSFSGLSMVPPAVRRVLDGLVSDNTGKRNTAVGLARDLREDELSTLVDLLEKHVRRHPEEKSGYEGLRVLAQAGITLAASSLATILRDNPLEPVPAAVGMEITTLAKTKPELRAILQPAIDRMAGSSTRVGAAAKKGAEPAKPPSVPRKNPSER